MKIDVDDDTLLRARRARDGITRARCWHDGYKAGGGHFLWYDSLIDAQVLCDRILQQGERKAQSKR